ncbi:caspase-9 isoform X2 [Sceloporus undulatus]|uniref:caspase-9 isoform X2 n=1 Tax=Sceloporus undulatus TaxID=8520 RepID=UPI001C4B6F68|nr:caspase-9 isoform X2 [Sceloporus undulatus]
MEEAQRLVLRRSRLRLASGTRRDQARQLVIDLESRGKQALPLFIGCLQETGQSSLAAFLAEGCCASQGPPADIKPIQVPSHSGQGDPTSESLPFPIQAMNQRHQEPTHDVSAAQGSVEERPRRNSETAYVLKSRPCGYCLIINNVNFSGATHLGLRLGSDVDCERLERRFKSLCFEVLTRQDLKAHEIASELQSLARRDHGSLDCCLVVILSHGCQTSHIQFPGGIYGTDGRRLAVEKIVSYFNGSNSPSLRGKPKIFFIQACGGEEKDRGFQVDFDASPGGQMSGRTVESDATPFQVQMGNSDELDAIASLPTPSDILVSYSTFPGFVSWRDKLTGSWYVETLDQVLEQYASSEDLLDMLLRVADAVSAKGTFKQMPGCFNFLRKRFFFMVK